MALRNFPLKISIILAAIALLAACAETDREAQARNAIRVDTVPKISIPGVVPNTPIDRVTGLAILSDGSVIVGDDGTRRLYNFTKNGQLRWSTGREGEGPNEFRRISAVFVTSHDSILVVDTWPSTYRLSVFSEAGNLVRTEPLNSEASTPVALLSDSELLYNRSALAGRRAEGLLRYQAIWSAVDLAGDSVRPLLTTEGKDTYFLRAGGMVIQIDPPFARAPRAVPVDGGFYLSAGTEARIDRYDLQGNLLSTIQLPTLERAVTKEDVQDFRDWFLNRYPEDARAEWRRRIEDLSAPEQWPPIGDLLVDDSGRLWIQAYQPPWVSELTWRVYTPDGAFIDEVSGPTDFSPHLIVRGWIYGVWKDSLDVQSIRAYEIDE